MAAESRLNVVIAAKDAASGPINGLRANLSRLSTEAKGGILAGVGLGGGIAAFGLFQRAAGAVVDVLGDSIHAAVQDEESISRLGQSLRANIPNWNGNTAAIERNLKAGMALGFADEDQRIALAGLTAATHDAAKAQDVLSVAMDLARFKHISLQEASDALVKVEAGRYRILASLGIQITKGATQTEALGAVMRVVAGQAEIFGKTTEGAFVEAGVAIDEAKERIGYGLLPFLKQVAYFARDVLAPNIDKVGIAAAGLGSILLISLIPRIIAAAVAFGALTLAAAPWLAIAGLMVGSIYLMSGAADDGQRHVGRYASAVKQAANDFSKLPVAVSQLLGEGGHRVAAAAKAALIDPIWFAAQEAKVKAEHEAAGIPRAMGDAMLAAQQDLTDSVKTLVEFMDKALTPAQEKAAAQAFLASDAYAKGMASGIPAVVAKATELANAALIVLHGAVGSAAAGGAAVGKAWYEALNAALKTGYAITASYVYKYQRLLGGSLPEEGPLAGKTAEHGGLAIGTAWALGINKGIDAVDLRFPMLPGMPAMSGASGPAMQTGSSGGSSGGYAPAGPIQVMLDGRVLAEYVDRRLYVAVQAAGGGYRPR